MPARPGVRPSSPPARRRDARPTACRRGYDRRWRAAREAYLADHPFCRTCRSAGRAESATVVDHVVPHKGDGGRFWDRSNWQPLCKPCHDRKTATTDGGFGRPPRGEGEAKSLPPPG